MNDQQLQEHVLQLEERVRRLEARLGATSAPPRADFTGNVAPPRGPRLPSAAPPASSFFPEMPALTATQLLGWGGVAALVLAAAYLIKLGIDLGWLTPVRQISLAALTGAALVGTGFVLRRADRHYASLLPAGGVTILYLCAYGAHLYYRLIPYPSAVAAVAATSLLALWLCRAFASELYAYLAVAGAYAAPLLLAGLRAGVGELALYYSAWSLLFCAFALWFGERRIYLTAAYLALLGFDAVWYLQWHNVAGSNWEGALFFQGLQFGLFAGTTALFSVRHAAPLDRDAALAHLPPLLLFYALQYALLDRHLPQWAPWVALASLALLFLVYVATRAATRDTLDGGRLLLTSYAALALGHAGYLEVLPDTAAPWAALAIGLALAAWLAVGRQLEPHHWPLLAAGGLIFVLNALRAMLHFQLDAVIGSDLLAPAYAVALYLGYLQLRQSSLYPDERRALLYAGHLAAMAAPVHLLDERLLVSLVWALLAVAALLLGLRRSDRALGQSALFLFGVAGAKVLLYDLAGSAPLIRIGCLALLGISFYFGGWLYRRVAALEDDSI